MIYFCKALSTSTPTEVINKYVFSSAYNFNANLASSEQQPAMLDRFLAGIMHPLIHVGYGVEFGIIQQIADGLAHTAIHHAKQGSILPAEFFKSPDPLLRGLSSSAPRKSRPPFLSFVSQLLSDTRLAPASLKLPHEDMPAGPTYAAANKAGAGEVVKELADKWYDAWIVGVSDDGLEDRIEGMVEDVLVSAAVMYGISGYAAKGDRAFNADFFTYAIISTCLICSLITIPLECTSSRRETSFHLSAFAQSAHAPRR